MSGNQYKTQNTSDNIRNVSKIGTNNNKQQQQQPKQSDQSSNVKICTPTLTSATPTPTSSSLATTTPTSTAASGVGGGGAVRKFNIPPLPIVRTVSDVDIAQLREMFEHELTTTAATSTLPYHRIDIERVRTERWQCERYLQRHPTVVDAFASLCRTLRWKKEIGIHDSTDDDYPREFYQINCVEILGRLGGGENDPILVWNTSLYSREFAEIRPWIKKFVAHELETYDRIAGSAGFVLVSDCKHAGVMTYDLEMSRYTNDLVQQHYPGAVRLTIILNLSMYLDPLFRLVLSFMTGELRATVQVLSRPKQYLPDFLPPEQIPIEYGGLRKTRTIRVPTNARSYADMPEYVGQLNETQKKRYATLLRKVLVQ